MGSEQSQLAGDGGGSAPFLFGRPFPGMEQSAQVAVAQPGQRKLPTADRFEQRSVLGRPGVERPVTVTVDRGWTAEGRSLFPQGRFARDTGQGLQITVVGRVADLAASR